MPLINFKVDSPWIWEKWKPHHHISGTPNNFSRKRSLPFVNIERLPIGLETKKKSLSSMVWNNALGGSLACIKYKLIFFQCEEWVCSFSMHVTKGRFQRWIDKFRERERVLIQLWISLSTAVSSTTLVTFPTPC